MPNTPIPTIYDADRNQFISGLKVRQPHKDAAREAVTYARATGSVGATVDGVSVRRLYVQVAGVTSPAGALFLVELPGADS